MMKKIEKASVGFRPLTESIDATTAVRRTMMQMVGSFAEFEVSGPTRQPAKNPQAATETAAPPCSALTAFSKLMANVSGQASCSAAPLSTAYSFQQPAR